MPPIIEIQTNEFTQMFFINKTTGSNFSNLITIFKKKYNCFLISTISNTSRIISHMTNFALNICMEATMIKLPKISLSPLRTWPIPRQESINFKYNTTLHSFNPFNYT